MAKMSRNGELLQNKLMDYSLTGLCLGMLGYQLSVVWSTGDPKVGQIFHMGLALAILILATNQKKSGYRPLLTTVAALGVLVAGSYYMAANFLQIAERLGYLKPADLLAIIPLMALVFIYAWRFFGPAFPIMGLIFIAYAFVGHYVPAPLSAPQSEVARTLSRIAVRMHGQVVQLSWGFLWLIIVFGSLLQASGAGQFVWTVAGAAAKRIPGGPALVSVVSSGMVGSFTGSPAANVGITGVVTIPAMKKTGWKPSQAAAIEALASHGGVLAPPVMGTVAFIMADFLGIPYWRIIMAATLPALLYYGSIALYVVQYARKHDLKQFVEIGESLTKNQFFRSAILFFTPIGLLLYFLINGLPMGNAIFWSTLVVVGLGFAIGERRPSVWINAVKAGAIGGASIAAAAAIVDIIIASTEITNFALRIGFIVRDFGGGTVLGTFLILALVAYVMGLGVSALLVYVIAAVLLVPVLLKLGVTPLVAHYVTFYLAGMASITPPMATTVLVAARLAGASYFQSAYWAVQFGAGVILLPFLIFWAPEMLLEYSSIGRLLIVFGMVVFAVTFLQIALVGYFRTTLPLPSRILSGAIPVLMWLGLYMESWTWSAAGLVLAVVVIFEGLKKRSAELEFGVAKPEPND
jgi:TRAP transporter 4TM/12TM fusion protein